MTLRRAAKLKNVPQVRGTWLTVSLAVIATRWLISVHRVQPDRSPVPRTTLRVLRVVRGRSAELKLSRVRIAMLGRSVAIKLLRVRVAVRGRPVARKLLCATPALRGHTVRPQERILVTYARQERSVRLERMYARLAR